MADLDVPIALRRTRRSNAGTAVPKQEEPTSASLPTPPKTPRRGKRAVRFSEPASSLSSGLTPMVRRTYLGAPQQQRRRASTPAIFRRSSTPACSRSAAPTPLTTCSSSTSAPRVLGDTVDGRVERRTRRAHMRNLLNKLDQEKRHKARAAQAQIEQLKTEIRLRDREIYELQNATVVVDTERVWDLEEQVKLLREELAQRPGGKNNYYDDDDDDDDDGMTEGPFSAAGDDGYADVTMMMGQDGAEYDDDDYDDHFGNETMAHFATSTPSRARSSFPTPPSTSPLLAPATPCSAGSRRMCLPTMTPKTPPRHTHTRTHAHTGTQVCAADPAKQQLEEELSSLQREVGKLTAALDSYKNLGARLRQQLAEVAPLHDAAAAAAAEEPDVLEAKVAALLQATAESTARAAQLSTAIAQLGFPGDDAGEMMAA
ncbi:hypothetical protein E4U21_007221, partial [Claviceps maximensis]